MKRMYIKVIVSAAGCIPAALSAFLPLYENPQLYRQLFMHNQQILPNLDSQLNDQRQRLIQWFSNHLSDEHYQTFRKRRLLETFEQAFDEAVKVRMTLEYAKRSLQLIDRYEKQIYQLNTTIAQLQAQEPLYAGSSGQGEQPSGVVLPEEFPSKKKRLEIIDQDMDDQESDGTNTESESEQQELEDDQVEQIISPSVLQQQSPFQAALVKSQLERVKKELENGMQQEQQGTAQPGWRERLMKKWQELKEWISGQGSAGDVES